MCAICAVKLVSGKMICAIPPVGLGMIDLRHLSRGYVWQGDLCHLCLELASGRMICAICAAELGHGKMICAICAANLASERMICAICAVKLAFAQRENLYHLCSE